MPALAKLETVIREVNGEERTIPIDPEAVAGSSENVAVSGNDVFGV